MNGDRTRSFWGWGYDDKLPNEEARRALGQQVAAFLGGERLAVRPLPQIDEITLRPPRVTPPLDLPTATTVTTATIDRVHHTYGKGYRDIVRALRRDFAAAPDLVAYPKSEEEVQSLLDWCARERVAAIPFGGGTSVVAGIEGDVGDRYRGVVSIDLRAMNRVLEVDAVSRAARIQAGALGPALEEQLAPHGFTLRHFPQSFEFSTLGGWIATRAGGHFATLYTHIDDLVESVRMVTSNGVFASRRLPASGAGPSPDRMVLGSEGILGIITEAWMRVQPRPRWRASASVHFTHFAQAVFAARALAQSGLYPSNCRLLDAHEARLNGVTFDGSSVLLVAFESADHSLEAWMERALAITRDAGGVSPKGPIFRSEGAKTDASQGESRDAAASWRQAFLDAPYLQSALASMGLVVDTFETACTWDRFDALHAAVSSAVGDAMKLVCGGGVLSCRFTHVYPDGPAPYFTFIARGREGEELAQWTEIKRAASDALLASGATITHHHAVGRLHRPWYDRERPEPFAAALRAMKGELDPAGVLNPGVLIDPIGPA
jgi:alkyldihydroxyacetonephosphate synthase